MRSVLVLLVTIVSICIGQSARALADDSYRAARPDWATLSPIPEGARRDEAQDGEYNLLLEGNFRLRPDGFDYHLHRAIEITSRNGLEAVSRFSAQYDPSNEDFHVIDIAVIRDGERRSRIGDMTLQAIRQETELHNGVIDGALTVFGEIPDVRVGDTIVYDMIWRSSSPLWPGHFFTVFDLGYSIPVENITTRIITEPGTDLTIRSSASDVEPRIFQEDGRTVYEWTVLSPPAIRGEDYVPLDYLQWDKVWVSTMADWSEVANWGAELYRLDLSLTEELARRVLAVRAEKTPHEQITWAIRYVQDEIRYVSDATGLGAYVPRPPATVIANGYGDCKDKSLLLVALLQALEFDAFPALTDIDEGPRLKLAAPAPTAFDHAIVGVPLDGGIVWIDATDSLQGGVFPDIAQPAYGYALPLQKDAALTRIEKKPLDQPDFTVEQVWDFAGLPDEEITFVNTSWRRGGVADAFRRQIEGSPMREINENWLAYYRSSYPGAERVGDIEITDDREANTIITTERYRIPAADYQGLLESFTFSAEGVEIQFPTPPTEHRMAPLDIPFPLFQAHRVIMENLPEENTGVPEQFHEDDLIRLGIRNMETGTRVVVDYMIRTKADTAPAERAAEITEQVAEFIDWQVLEIDLQEGDAVGFAASEWVILAFAGALAFAFLAAIPLIIWTFKADDAFQGERSLIPVPMSKFIILSALSAGAYAYFWVWRCWRRVKQDGQNINPFLRFFFLLFYFYPFYDEVRRRDSKRAPRALGVVLALIYAVATIIEAGSNSDRAGPDVARVGSIIALFTWLTFVPMAMMALRANGGNADAKAHHAVWSARTIVGLLVGLTFLAFSSYLIVFPE